MKAINSLFKFFTKPIIKVVLIGLIASAVFASASHAKNEKAFDGIFYVLKKLPGHEHKHIHLYAKLGEVQSIPFHGIIEIPKSVKLIYGAATSGSDGVQLKFDNVVCSYEARSDRRMFNHHYDLSDCSNGADHGDELKVKKSISIALNLARYNFSKVKADISVVERFQTGLQIPHLDASAGQILRFDGELWRPVDYIPDGNEAGEILTWDGGSWVSAPASSAQGPMGPQGPAGPQGEQGVAGADGAQGPQGIQGEKGDKGDQGDVGPQGPAGSQGVAGPMGPQGPAGPQGEQGVAGADGAQGPQGIQGEKGDKGDQGDVGPQGPAGPQGVAGPMGPQGPAGPQGPQGVAGADGAQGPQGIQGEKGDKGDKGDVGPQGPAGPQGIQGEKGDKGDQGEKGDKGEDAVVALMPGAGIVAGSGPLGAITGTDQLNVNVGTGAGQIPQLDANGRLPASVIPEGIGGGGSSGSQVVYIKDIKPSGAHGGTCTAGIWVQRELNNVSGNGSFASLSGNQFTLQPGTYTVDAIAPSYLDNVHKAILFNLSSGTTQIAGTTGRSHTTAGGVNNSSIQGVVVVSSPTTFEIRHRCVATKDLIGFGLAADFGEDEVYTQVKIVKID